MRRNESSWADEVSEALDLTNAESSGRNQPSPRNTRSISGSLVQSQSQFLARSNGLPWPSSWGGVWAFQVIYYIIYN